MFSKLKIIFYTITFLLSLTFASSVSAAITIRPALNLGLVGYWAMDEGYGSKAYDQGGSGNNGTLTQMDPATDWVDGKLGKALSFDGTGQSVNLASSPVTTWQTDQGVTISIWVKSWPNLQRNCALELWDSANPERRLTVCSDAYSPYNRVNVTAGREFSESEVTIHSTATLDSNWHHIVFVVGNNTGKLYIDGQLNDSDASITSFGTMNLNTGTIGTGNTSNGDLDSNVYPFTGKLDEVRIYNRALSAGEITRLYNLTKPKLLAPNNLGLVGYWSFEEGTGTKAGDMSGNGNTGTTTGTAWVDGKRGKALNFDGTDDYVAAPDSPSLDITGDLTITGWIYPRDSNSSDRLVTKRVSEYSDGYDIMTWGGKMNIMINTWDVVGNLSYSANQWAHFTFTKSGTTGTLYKNGIFDASWSNAPATINTNNASLIIGGAFSYMFDGLIDEVRIYNRALSATEVANLYTASKKIMKVNTSQNSKLTTGLVGMWSFNGQDVAGNIAFDRSGQGKNGTISGATLDSGKVGQALSFDGVDDYVNIPDPNLVEGLTAMSVSVWAKSNTTVTANGRGIVAQSYGTSGATFILFLRNIDNIAFQVDTGVSVIADANTDLPDTNWHHYVGVYNGSNVLLYVDSVLQTSQPVQTGTTTASTNPVTIGAYDSTRNWDGLIDEARIYNRALGAEEIKRLYNLGK